MSNIYTTPHPFDPTDPKNLKISRIEDRESSIEIIFKDRKLRSEKIVELHLLQLLQEESIFLTPTLDQEHFLSPADLVDAAQRMQILFEALAEEDLSQNILFAEKLSTVWYILLKIDALKRNSQKKIMPMTQLECFLKELLSYPDQSDHTLGYYLTEYTGEKWIPFPFMEILRHLHEEALALPVSCKLAEWKSHLNTIIQKTS